MNLERSWSRKVRVQENQLNGRLALGLGETNMQFKGHLEANNSALKEKQGQGDLIYKPKSGNQQKNQI